jgi:hypothetical protein
MRRSVYHAAKVITRFLWVRFHVTLILVVVVMVGLLANWLALHLGLRTMAVRYPLGVLVGYGAFFAGVKVWLGYAETALSPKLRAELVRVELDPRPGAAPMESPKQPWWERMNLDLPDPGDGDGCLLVAIVLIVVMVLFGVGAFVVGEAPFILGEALVQFSLAAALRGRARQIDTGHWSGAVLRSTWGPALVVLLLAAFLGLLLQLHCPSAARLFEALLFCPR